MEEIHKKSVTCMLILIWVSMGLYVEIAGPTMIDLRMRFDADSESVARSISALGVGVFVGALLGGLLIDTLGTWKILLVTAAQVLVTVVIVSMPFVGSLGALWVMFFALGTSAGVVNVSGQRIILEMWKENAPTPMHATHMGFGIGALTAPLIANPFLAKLAFNDETSLTAINGTSTNSSSGFVVIEESRVHLAYVTIGVISALLSLPVFIYPIMKCCRLKGNNNYDSFDEDKSTKPTKSFRNFLRSIDPRTYASGSGFGIFIFVIIILYFVNLVGGEHLFGNFIRTYSVDQLHFPRNEASYLDTIYWGSFTMGRLLGSLLAHCIHIRTLFAFDAVMYLLSVSLFNVFSANNDSKAVLWAFTAIIGLLVAPLFPAGISYTNTQIEVGGVILTLVVFATGCGQLLYIWIEGVLYQDYGPQTTLYSMQTSSILVFIIAILFICFTYKRGDRFSDFRQSLVNNATKEMDVNTGETGYTQLDKSSAESQ
ncbi:hypothetical protein ACF0H5_008187 [Mactra antiquata]